MTASFYISTSNAQRLQFLHILANTYYFLIFLLAAKVMGVRWYIGLLILLFAS